MSVEEAAAPQAEPEALSAPAPPTESGSRGGGLVVLLMIGLVVSAGIAVALAAQLSSAGMEAGVLSARHRTELAAKDAELARLAREQERMTGQLRQSFATNKTLLKERDELKLKVDAFQGSLAPGGRSALAGSRLPPMGAIPLEVPPVSIKPLPVGPAPAGSAGLTLRDGGRLLVQRPDGFYQLQKLPSNYEAALGKDGLRVSGLPRLLARIAAPVDGLFKLVFPVKAVLETNRPAFNWTAAPEAGSKYQVTVTADDGRVASRSGWVEGLTWTPPEPLARGKVYRWTVRVLAGDGAEPKDRAPDDAIPFAVVGEDELRKLERVRKDSPDSPLLLGLAHAEAGLVPPAIEHLQKLRQQNPTSPLPDALLLQIRRATS